MVTSEVNAKEKIKTITNATNYLKEKTGQTNFERNKRVAEELFEKNLPIEAINATILKELPNNLINENEITQLFGETTTQNVKTIKQIEDIIERNFGKLPSETLTSIILSISQTFQPIIIKTAEIADALYNKEKFISEDNYAKKAEEIYYPLATKLGLGESAWKIQDYSFRVLNPAGFEKVKKLVNKTRIEREALVETVQKEIESLLVGKIQVKVTGRPKNFKSIFEKLKKTPFSKMNDIYGIRIICNKEKECYETLGYIHSKYEIIPEAFDDYISKPKNTGYKSIHTAVRRGNEVIEIQIRTWEHHLRIEGETYWNYKQIQKDKEFEKELGWERQLIEWQKSLGKEVFGKKSVGRRIFVFTPKHDVISLPIGASVIDFAYAVHTDIGKKMEKARVNGNFAPLETKLNNLDQVEIIVAEKPQLKKTWLGFVVTDKAKQKIKTYFGLKVNMQKKEKAPQIGALKKIKMAECCHPLPGEDVIGVKTTKRKIIVHKTTCPNIKKISKDKLISIGFEREKGKTEIRVKAIDRPGILSEILTEIKKSGATLINTNFKIKKNGYAEAIFGIEINGVAKLERLLEKIEEIPSVQAAERI
ncbi:MAG: TGS domain-containing protein [archaeon]|jgi:GTP pyrophosphokinase